MKKSPANPLDVSMRRYYVDSFYSEQFSKIPAGSSVLDLGGHKFGKRGQFDVTHFDVSVWTANISSKKGADIICDAVNVAAGANTFDVVVCGEILEHLWKPQLVLNEAYRVLKRGGVFLATVPFLFHIHADPADFGRYTGYYWEKSLTESGFSQITLCHQGLFYAVMASHLEQYLGQFRPPAPLARPISWFLAKGVIKPMKRAAIWHEKKPRVFNNSFFKSFTTGFGIFGVKN